MWLGFWGPQSAKQGQKLTWVIKIFSKRTQIISTTNTFVPLPCPLLVCFAHMANTLDKGKFRLPSEFLTGDDLHLLMMSNQNLHKHGLNSALEANYGFPTVFPCDFGLFDSPAESVGAPTETESEVEDLLAGLTRQLARSKLQENARRTTSAPQNPENPWLLSGSPKSTLFAVGSWSDRSAVSSNGSPNGPSQVPSPPTSPPGGKNDAWNLIHAAAGQVARLKMNGEGPSPEDRGLLVPNWNLTHVHRTSPPATNPNTGFYANQCFFSDDFPQTIHLEHARQDQMLKQQQSSMWGRQTREGLFCQRNTLQQQVMPESRGVRVLGGGGGLESNRKSALPNAAWPPALHQNQLTQRSDSGMRAFFLAGSGVKKRECAGTGVFLPRRYGHPSESSKKPGSSTALLPARVVQSLNKNFHDMTSQPQAQPANGTLMARRNAMLTQQRNAILKQRSQGLYNHELLCLPQEWTY